MISYNFYCHIDAKLRAKISQRPTYKYTLLPKNIEFELSRLTLPYKKLKRKNNPWRDKLISIQLLVL